MYGVKECDDGSLLVLYKHLLSLSEYTYCIALYVLP